MRFRVFVAVFLFLPVLALGQSITGTPPTDPTRGGPQVTIGVILYGQVLMADGAPPPDGIEVEYACHNVTLMRSNIDRKGNYRFDLSATNQFNTRQDSLRQTLVDCEVRVQDSRYPIARKDLTSFKLGVSNELPPLVLRNPTRAESLIVSMNTLKAPGNAKKAFHDGMESVAKKDIPKAKANFEKATKLYPEYSAAWYELGLVHLRAGEIDDAKAAFRTSSERDPDYVNPLLQLGMLAMREQDWKSAKEISTNILKFAPEEFAQVYLIHGGACFNLSEVEAAEKSVRHGIAIDKDKHAPRLFALLGMILAGKNDNAGAAQAFRDYLAAMPEAPDAAKVRERIAALEQRAGK